MCVFVIFCRVWPQNLTRSNAKLRRIVASRPASSSAGILSRYFRWDCLILCPLRHIILSPIPVDQPAIIIAHDGISINTLVVEVMLISPQIELDRGDVVRLEFG